MNIFKKVLIIFSYVISNNVFAQTHINTDIQAVLDKQQGAWNQGDIEGYMQGYYNSDSLMFIGKNGIQWGWHQTLENYKKSYPTSEAMGQLRFEIEQCEALCNNYYFVIGQWFLTRSKGDLNGSFSLLFKKINGQWYIIKDHSS